MVYIHIPFCRSFCTYCDFYSEIACKGRDDAQIEQYVRDICVEMDERSPEIRASQQMDTLYIGGGTPSVLPLSALRIIVERLKHICGPSYRSMQSAKHYWAEFTMEINPEDIVEKGVGYVRELIDLGVNRFSMGVQSLDDTILRWMNRRHDSQRAIQAYSYLREAGAANISIDLIFGISQLSDKILSSTLDAICTMRPEHISAYQLSIEAGSVLAAMLESGHYQEASDEQCAAQYSLICNRLREAGYVHYEISNWALPGHQALHNSAYWSRQAYVGLGPGAHSFDGIRRRSWNADRLANWRCDAQEEYLDDAQVREEQIMLGLRTSHGISAELCDADSITMGIERGYLERLETIDAVRIPEGKLFICDEIISELI